MSMIQVRDVPDRLHRELIWGTLEWDVARPSSEEVFDRIERSPSVRLGRPAAQLLRDDRDRFGRALVIGYGNTLRRDDGVGVRVTEMLAEDPRFGGVDVAAVHQLTPELALDIGDCAVVVFIDADTAGEPGEITVREVAISAPRSDADARAEPGASTHHVGAGELLALAEQLIGHRPAGFAVGIGVADLELGEGLSPVVEASLHEVVDTVARLVAR